MHEKIYPFNLTKIGLKTTFYLFVFSILFGSKLHGQTTPKRIAPTQPTLTLEQIAAKAGVLIDVNTSSYPESNYSISQIVNNVLLSAGSYCTTNNATNVTVHPNQPATSTNRSWGYFNRATTNFPFKSGLVLSTGYASSAGNTAVFASSTLGSGSDADLATALGVTFPTYDATSVEFDFVPFTNTVTFRYILASEEYSNGYECFFTDGFALLLKKVGDPTYTNIAVLPNNAGPVSVTNIHPAVYGIAGTCSTKNENYFYGYNTSNIETNYNGRTVPLTAVANVIPGQTYHFKMVLADVNDDQWDTAVFLEADSFDIGIKILDAGGLELPSSITFCEESPQLLTASTSIVGATFKWYFNNTLIPGATSNTYTATQAGNYRVEINIPGTSCSNSASIELIQGAKPTLELTDNNGAPLVSPLAICGNINQIIQANTNATGGVFEWYFNNTLIPGATSNTYTATQTGTYKAKVKTSSLPCESDFKEITITTYNSPAPTITASSTILCPSSTVTLTSSSPTNNVWSTGETTPSITVNSAGTYTLKTLVGTCSSLPASITIVPETNANVSISGTLNFCEGTSTTLTATATGTGLSYSWNTGATTPTITVDSSGTYTVTATTTNGCTFTQSVNVVQNPLPTVQNGSLTECTTTGTADFNLTTAQNQISTTPGVTFSFYQNLADAQAQNSNTITTPSNFNYGNTTVYVLVKLGNCFRIAELQLNVTQNATPTITASNTTICSSGTVTLTSNAATGNTWSTGETTQAITVTSAGTYTLTNTAGSCASLPASITIVAETNPNVTISGDLAFCEGTSTTLTATATGTGLTYSWNTGATTPTITVNSSGTYTVTATTTNGCTFTQSVNVVQNPLPTVQNGSLTECTTTGTADFNLTTAQTQISTTPGVTFSFYQNLADAQAQNSNTITTPSNFNSGNTTVYVLVKLGNCFRIAELQLNVTQNATPTITASNTTICSSGTVTLTSSAATGNTWSTGETTQAITVTSAGTYTLTNTAGSCASLPASITIVAETNPNVTISGDLAFCEGTSTTLTASATGTGLSYSWNTGATTPSITATTPGTFTINVTTANGCIYSESVTVIENPLPIVQNASISQCSGNANSTFDLTSVQNQISTTAGVTFSYYANQADAQAANSNTIATPTNYTTGSTTIYVLVKLGNCSKIAELSLNVNGKPQPTISQSPAAICDGSSVTLTSSLPTGNTWSTGETTQSIVVSTAGTYTLTNNNGLCTSDPVSLNVIANPNPNIQISGNLNFCDGDSTTLTATATGTGNTFAWSNGTTGASTTINTSGTFTVTVTTSGGCQYSKSVTTVKDPPINITIATPNILTCHDPQTTLNATGSTFEPGSTFLWTTTTGTIVSGANTLTPTVSAAGTYTLTITNPTPLACTKQGNVVVTANQAPPNIVLTASQMTICKGYSVTITANGAASYTWAANGASGDTQTFSPTETTTYTVSGIGTNGCPSTTPGTITIKVVPDITSPLSDMEICQGDTAILDAGYDPTYSYLWSTGETTQKINTAIAGTYSVTITNEGCSKSFSMVLGYTVLPTIDEVLYENKTLTIKATNNSNSPLEYSIDNGVTWQSSPVFTNVNKNTLYQIHVKNVRSTCSAQVEYYTYFIPNTITPNGDGINDTVDFAEMVKFNQFDAMIYDRYGKIIFKPTVSNSVWNGTYNGRPIPTGTYWYKISWVDKISNKPLQFTGWILIKNRE